MKVGLAPLRRNRNGAVPRSRVGRIGIGLLWWVLPALAATLVGGYLMLALARGVNPPVVPVEGVSMHPLLHAGDLVLLKHVDVAHLRKGDIIAFRTSSDVQKKWHVPGSYVHRIVKVEKGSNGYQFQTKGDNNAGKDPFWTTGDEVTGEYAGKIGGAGYPILFVRSKQGKILIAAVIGILALYALLGVFERRSEAQELNMLTLAGIVEEARGLKDAMEHAATPPERAPPTPAALIPWDPPPRPADQTDDIQATMRELVGAISEYGEHLRSHTAVMKNLAATTKELQNATQALGVGVRGAFVRPEQQSPEHGAPVPLLDFPVLAQLDLTGAPAPAPAGLDARLDRLARRLDERSLAFAELRRELRS